MGVVKWKMKCKYNRYNAESHTHADHSAAIVDLKRTEYGRALDTLSAQAETIADLRSTASFEQVASTSDQARIVCRVILFKGLLMQKK